MATSVEVTNISQEPPSKGLATLSSSLLHTLTELSLNPFPHVPNPENCKKRASVALILRIRPHYNHWPSSSDLASLDNTQPFSRQIENFFAKPWVQHGDPEVVFIKRAARDGDRWTSHVALPGGKRDAEDVDDKATAMRETAEEIGLDLTSPDAFFVGNLPERVVSTSWGKVPIMVLCPFLFLYTKPDIPPLKLQPTEVASAHWVPLRALLSSSSRTYEYVDVSDRFSRQGGAILKALIRSVLGKMRFSAVQLVPTESLHSTAEFCSPPETLNRQLKNKKSLSSRLYAWYLGDQVGFSERTRPLLLWGLTLGILADFLDHLPPHNAVKLWSYPTFTSLDTRFIISILTRGLKARNQTRLRQSGMLNQTALDSETEATALAPGDNAWSTGGLTKGIKYDGGEKGKNSGKEYAVGIMLEGYYDMARRGILAAAALRLCSTLALVMYILRRFKQRRNG